MISRPCLQPHLRSTPDAPSASVRPLLRSRGRALTLAARRKMLSDASVLASVPLALPSLWALSFVVPLGLQALLLHPRFSDAVSRPLRFLLLFPAVYLAYRAPYTYRIEPHEQAIGFNFRMGIFGPNFVLLSLTWGLARDRSHYAWLGFLDEKKMEGMGKEESNVGAKATRRRGKAKNGFMQVADAQAGAASAAAQEAEVKTIVAGRYDSPYQIAMSTIHLLTSMRGVGYAFGPPVHALKYSAPARKTNPQFFKAALSGLIVAHVASTLCLIVIVTPQEQRVAILQSFVPRFIPASALENFCLFASYIAVGLSLHANMNIGFESTSLVALVLNLTLRAVAPTHYRPERFNSLEYPTLFDRPYWPSEGVGSFWRSRWHGLFAVFSVFYWQVLSIFGWAFGKDVGKIAGVAVVFGLSAWLHHDGE